MIKIGAGNLNEVFEELEREKVSQERLSYHHFVMQWLQLTKNTLE